MNNTSSTTNSSVIKEEPACIHVGEYELTWPIWHMLSFTEKRDIAAKRGFSSIGEFEEEMTLQRALNLTYQVEEQAHRDAAHAADALFYHSQHNNNNTDEEEEDGTTSRDDELSHDDVDDDDDDEFNTFQGKTEEEYIGITQNKVDDTTDTEGAEDNIENGSWIIQLPIEILRNLMEYLDVDAYGIVAMVSPHWAFFTRSEYAYRKLCERCYLNQSKRKVLNINKWGGSYRNMLVNRPRVRLNGVYVLQYKQIKKIQRDMWTEIPIGAVLEHIYYRYIVFQENGTALYALTATPPHEMIQRFIKMKMTGSIDKTAVVARYEVAKYDVKLWASHHWSDILLNLKIIPDTGFVNGGKFCAMQFHRHRLSKSGDFDEHSRDVVEFDVPTEYFRFFREWRL